MANYGRWNRTITDAAGNIVNATVTVYRESDGLAAAIYSDRTGTAKANPFTLSNTDKGLAFFHAAGGAYKIVATYGNWSQTWRYEGVGTASEYDVDSFVGAGQAPAVVSTRTALKALATATYKIASLNEGGRSGTFVFLSGNYSTYVTADTSEGIFIKANDTASSSGAWVRIYAERIMANWFGATADSGSTDNSTAFQAAIDLVATFSSGGAVSAFDAPGYYGIANPLVWKQLVSFDFSDRVSITATASMTAMLTTPSLVGDRVERVSIRGGVWDGNLLAETAIWARAFTRLGIESLRTLHCTKYPIRCGNSSFNCYELSLRHLVLERRSATTVVSGSSGILVDTGGVSDSHCEDVFITGYEYGIYGSAYGWNISKVHPWFGESLGQMVACFKINGTGNYLTNCVADYGREGSGTVSEAYGYWFTAGPNFMFGSRMIYAPGGAPANTDLGVRVDSGAELHATDCMIEGDSGTYLSTDYSGSDLSNLHVTGQYNHYVTTAKVDANGRYGTGLGTSDSPQFAGINVGHATDTTITRTSAGNIAVEGNAIYRAGGTDVPVADGGTGASNAATARANLGVREALAADRTYYVRTDGSDSNTGLANSSGGAFLTIQKALDVAKTLDFAGFTVTVQVADGTYTGSVSVPVMTGQAGVANLVIQGNTGTPGNAIWSCTSANCLSVGFGAAVTVSGFEFRTTTGGQCFSVTQGGALRFTTVRFGACAAAHILCATGGKISCSGNYSIVGGAVEHVNAYLGGLVQINSVTVTISGTPAFSYVFANVVDGALLEITGNTYSGSATGQRYAAANGGVIQTYGAGTTALPGNSAGSGTNMGTSPYGTYA